MRKLLIATSLLLMGFTVSAQKSQTIDQKHNGLASYYHDKFEGRRTATGEVFNNSRYTAASNTVSLGKYVKVTNLDNGKVVYVRINDRMAASNKRAIDLAEVAAKDLRFINKGLARVRVEVVSEAEGKRGVLAQRQMQQQAGNRL
jgi:rare lipoprotein A